MEGGFNPQGVSVTSFGVPSPEERLHDFLWRHHLAAPRRGYVGIHNRSHYESVLVERVAKLVPSSTWRRRYDQINEWEAELASEGTTIVKLYLNIDRDEQKERLQARLDDPTKHWKFNPADLKVRAQWDDYMGAYEDALSRCSTDVAPWYVVPANRKWFRNLAVAEILVATMDAMKLHYPPDAFDPKTITIENPQARIGLRGGTSLERLRVHQPEQDGQAGDPDRSRRPRVPRCLQLGQARGPLPRRPVLPLELCHAPGVLGAELPADGGQRHGRHVAISGSTVLSPSTGNAAARPSSARAMTAESNAAGRS